MDRLTRIAVRLLAEHDGYDLDDARALWELQPQRRRDNFLGQAIAELRAFRAGRRAVLLE